MFSKGFSLNDETPGLTWHDLNQGAPTIIAMAHLSSVALSKLEAPLTDSDNLTDEAKAILVATRNSGSICIRGDKNAFEPSERFLAVCVELDEGRRVEFRCVNNPRQTVRFMDGLRQLCANGLVMHQLMNDFSLSSSGFDLAQSLDAAEFQSLIDLGNETL